MSTSVGHVSLCVCVREGGREGGRGWFVSLFDISVWPEGFNNEQNDSFGKGRRDLRAMKV